MCVYFFVFCFCVFRGVDFVVVLFGWFSIVSEKSGRKQQQKNLKKNVTKETKQK